MASCFLAKDTAHFNLCCSLENNTKVLSSHSFEKSESPLSTGAESSSVSNLCAQVVLASPSRMQSMRKSTVTRSGRRLSSDASLCLSGSKEEVASSATPYKSKIVTRRYAEKLELVAAQTSAKNSVSPSNEEAGNKRRTRKRSSTGSLKQENDSSVTDSPKEVKEFCEPEKKRKLRSDKSEETPQRVPGTPFKVCANCGTVADKSKAKKCRQCKKFFFNHWAKRCRIPPCPKCHFSRKSKPQESVPTVCEKCGADLPIEEGSDVKSDSSSAKQESNVSSKTTFKDDNSESGRRDSKSDDLSLTSTTTSTSPGSPSKYDDSKLLEEQSDMTPIANAVKRIPSIELPEKKVEECQVEDKSDVVTVGASDISMGCCKDGNVSNARQNIEAEEQRLEITKGLPAGEQEASIPVTSEALSDQRGTRDLTGQHQLGSGQVVRVDEHGTTTEKQGTAAERQGTAVREMSSMKGQFVNIVSSYPRVSVRPLATRSSSSKTPFVNGPAALDGATTPGLASNSNPQPVIPSIINAMSSSSCSIASLQYAGAANKVGITSRSSVQPIEKSLKEHFERSLIGVSESTTTQVSSTVRYPASTGYSFTPVYQKSAHPTEKVEGKIEIAAMEKIDRFGQPGWSGSVASLSPVTEVATPTIATARLGAGYLPQARSDIDVGNSLTKFGYISPSPNFPAFLQVLSNHCQRSASEKSTGSPQSPILVFPPVVPSILTPSLQSLAPICSTPISLPRLPSTCISSSSSLSTSVTTPTQDVSTRTVFKPQSAAGPPATSSTPFISSSLANIPGSKSAKCPVIVIPHSDSPLPENKVHKIPPTTVTPLLAGCSDVGTSCVDSKASKEARAEAEADVYIVEKKSQPLTGLGTGQNTGAMGYSWSTSVQRHGAMTSSQSSFYPLLGAVSSCCPAQGSQTHIVTLDNYQSRVDGQAVDNPFPSGHKLITSHPLPKVDSKKNFGCQVVQPPSSTSDNYRSHVDGQVVDNPFPPGHKLITSHPLPMVDSKSLGSPVVQPPSLVSIGAAGTVTITRSYTLPQAPRVSIAVAPPPLQNIKDDLASRTSIQQTTSITSAAPAKLESKVKALSSDGVKSQAVSVGNSNPIPPLVHCSSSSISLADTQLDAKSDGTKQFASSDTVTVDIVSSTNPRILTSQNGPVLSCEQQKNTMGPSTGSQFSSLSDRVRLSSVEYKGPFEGSQKGFDNYTPSAEGALQHNQSSTASSSAPIKAAQSGIPLPSQSSFQKLDLQVPHTANKIRVSLLKDNSSFDSSSSCSSSSTGSSSTTTTITTTTTTTSTMNHTMRMSSPTPPISPLFPPSNTRMITKVYEFPLQLPGTTASSHLTVGQMVSLPSFSSISSGSVVTSCGVTSPMPLNNLPSTLMTTAAMSVTPLPAVNVGHGVTAAVIKTSSSSLGPAGTKNVFKWPISTSTLPSWSNKSTRDGNSSGNAAVTLKGMAEEDEEVTILENSEEGSARTNGVGLQYRVYRNMDAPEQPQKGNTDGISSSDEASQIVSQSGTFSKKTNYRKILPNTLKNVATSCQATCATSTSATSPSHSQVRSGVVTVQVCSSIPATLSLSSIIPPKISQSEAVCCESGGYVSSSSDTGANSADVSSRVRRGGGGVMVTPLSPSVLPPGRTVAQIVTSSIAAKDSSMLLEARKMEDKDSGHPSMMCSEEFLNSSNESGSGQNLEATGNGNGDGKDGSGEGKGASAASDKDGEEEEDNDEGEEGEKEGQDREEKDDRGSQDSKDRKRKREGKSKKDQVLYTVKLRDCYMHHMMWEEHRVVLIVPTHQNSDCNKKSRLSTGSGDGSSSGSNALMDSVNTSIGERRRRRKTKHEVLQDADDEGEEVDGEGEETASLSTSSSHVRSPCFSMYELRLKHFRHMTSNAVYAYTYKHQIKSLRTPTHWVQVLRRMGGVQEYGHTFRLIDILRVKEMCQQFEVLSSWPSNLDALARNEFPKSRILIDLSHFTPNQLMDTERLEIIPACPCAKPPTPPPVDAKPKRNYTKRKHMLKEDKKKKRKYKRKDSEDVPSNKKSKLDESNPEDTAVMGESDANQSVVESRASSVEPQVAQGAPVHRATLPLPEDSGHTDRPPPRKAASRRWPNGGTGGGQKGEEREEEKVEEEEDEEEEMEMSPPSTKKLEAGPSRQAEMPSPTIKSKKKVCPECLTPIPRKCKKCPSCGRSFGVFTFGRKVCPTCGRTNKARMMECFQCGHTLSNAPKALPRVYNALSDTYMEQPKPYSRTGSVFGARKKRNLHSFSGYSSSSVSSQNHNSSSKLKDSTMLLQPKMKLNQLATQNSPNKMIDRLESSERRHADIGAKGFDQRQEHGKSNGDDTEDPVGTSQRAPAPLLLAGKTEKEFEGRAKAASKPKASGYQYGRVAWGEADITCLVDEKGVVKVCLQELCTKVLQNHGKGNVLDVVKNLDLPLEHGDATLLRKLQALGLHSNRSPICRLIASEELWTLLDALEEPVPEEVYHHLDQISTCNTPLLSPQEMLESANGEAATEDSNLSAAADCDGGNSGDVESVEMTTPAADAGDKRGGGRGGEKAPPTSAEDTTQSPQHESTGAGGGGSMVEDDERGFESTLHEVECSDGQSVSILQTFNGDQFACVTEFWRKYFPEVNRNHLTSALKRLNLETILPTGQQATLLRSAGVISLRGAAGRLMKFESMEKLLDDFGIPLQIGKPTDKIYFSSKPTHPLNTAPNHVGRPRLSVRRPMLRSYNALSGQGAHQATMPDLPPDKVLVPKEDAAYASFMKNILGAIDPNDLQTLLVDVQQKTLNSSSGIGSESSVVESDISAIQQLIFTRRQLCNVLANEIGYLTSSNLGYMAESIRLDQMEKQFLKDIQDLLNTYDISLLHNE